MYETKKTKKFHRIRPKFLQNKTKKKSFRNFSQYFPSVSEKQNIAKRLNPLQETDIIQEYNKLQNLSCKQVQLQSSETRLGNNIVDYFTLTERLHTKGKQQIDFYTFWKNRRHFKKLPYVKKMYNYHKTRNIDDIRKYRYIFTLYFSSVSIFRPLMAMELYCKVNAKKVLDFTMGWGGRLLGAHVLQLDSYIGIDMNKNLKPLYENMVDFLRKRETTPHTNIQLFYKNALDVDYSTLDYDTVFTSPPYYNYETYSHMNKYNENKEEWNETFYKPIINRTWKHLKKDGHYCLNVPTEIYKTICLPILGKYHMRLALKKKKRIENAPYKEYIYIWKKG